MKNCVLLAIILMAFIVTSCNEKETLNKSDSIDNNESFLLATDINDIKLQNDNDNKTHFVVDSNNEISFVLNESNENEIKQEEVSNNCDEVWSNYAETESKNLNKLEEDEYFSFVYEDEILEIFKNDTSGESLYITIPKTTSYFAQLSEDKKIALFYGDYREDGMNPYLYLNGYEGTIEFLGYFRRDSVRLDKSGTYALYTKKDKTNNFILLNLETKQETEYNWKLNNIEKWADMSINYNVYRSADRDEFDFMVTCTVSRLAIAKAYYKIENGEFSTSYDDSDKGEIDLRDKEKYATEFYGY